MRWIPIAAFGTALVAIAGCATAPPAPDPIVTDTYYVREGMVRAINPPIEAIWNLQVEVMDDYGNFDPALMTQDHWANLEEQAQLLALASQRMAQASRYEAADPDGPYATAPVGTDLAAIQHRLDTSTPAYRALSDNLARHSENLLAASRAQDAALVTQLVNDMQPTCKACHDAFWYPEEYQNQP